MPNKKPKQKPDKQEKNRKRKNLFPPGVSGNPKGRPKKEHCFSDIAREMLASKELHIELTTKKGKKKSIDIKSNKSIYHGMIGALITEGYKGNVQAIRELADRVDGKPPQSIAVKGDRVFNITYQEG